MRGVIVTMIIIFLMGRALPPAYSIVHILMTFIITACALTQTLGSLNTFHH